MSDDRAGTDLVLIEDDEGDAVLVRALLEETGEGRELEWARSLSEAREHLSHGPSCVLLDLGLPDVDGNAAVREVVRLAPDAAVIVLTGLDDDERGTKAMAAGAQDYLEKGAVDGSLLERSIRYSIERKRAATTARRLREAEMRAEENDRLERGLLPRPLLRSDALRCMTLYEPGGDEALLGGDFFDVVELPNGRTRAMIGDVAGHGPDEAALGVRLRVAWRTLVLAGVDTLRTLAALQDLFFSERPDPASFATVCDLEISPGQDHLTVALAGHSPPLLLANGAVQPIKTPPGAPIGVLDEASWATTTVALGEHWALLLYTDGLVENVVTTGGARGRIGDEGLAALVRSCVKRGDDIADIVATTLAELADRRSSTRSDDVAIVALSCKLPG